MDEVLLKAYRDTDYLVCMDTVQWARIRVDQTLPEPLQHKIGSHTWGFITAWNPLSAVRTEAENLEAQQQMYAALQAMPDALTMLSAIGIGRNGWYEPSVFVIGPQPAALDALCRIHQQHAYLCGKATLPARLRVLSA